MKSFDHNIIIIAIFVIVVIDMIIVVIMNMKKSPDNITDAKGNDNQYENWCDFLIALLPWRLLLIQKAWLLKKEKSDIQNIKEGILFKLACSYCVYNESGWTDNVFQKSKIQVIKGALTIYKEPEYFPSLWCLFSFKQ